jgi:hypothetical protein
MRILVSYPESGRFWGIEERIVTRQDTPAGPAAAFPNPPRTPLAVAPWGDMIVTMRSQTPDRDLTVHSPHLPAARELLERPLLHHTPRDLKRARELLSLIGEPEVRDALEALAACLEVRFGGDIALGHGPVFADGPQDIVLGDSGTRG